MSTPVLFVSLTADGAPFEGGAPGDTIHFLHENDSPRLRIVDFWVVVRAEGQDNHQVVVGTGDPDPVDASVGYVGDFTIDDPNFGVGDVIRTPYINPDTFEIGAGSSLWVSRLFGANADVYILAEPL